jgi:radical SAM peptide maturase (CXXX-repeat target family)
MKAVNHYRDTYGVVMGSKMTIAPGNVEYVADAVISLIEHGYVDINLNCVYEKGWTAEHAKILYQQLKRLGDYLLENGLDETVSVSMFDQSLFHPKREDDLQNWCGGTGLMLAVDWKGDLYPCIRYMESSLGDIAKPLIIGNVWDGILQSHEQKCICECLDCINRRTQSTDECFYCPVAEGCSWCSAYNYQEFGTADHRATYICIMHKARALANAYYWNKALRIREPGSGRRFKIWLPEEDALKIISEDEWKLLKFLESGRELNGTADQENHGA